MFLRRMFELAVVLSRSSGLHAACSNQLRDLPSVSFCAASPSSHRPVVVSKFESGQQVWIAGRAATFLYHDGEEAAVIRYQGEQATRVVPLRKIAALLPDRGLPAPGSAQP
jgi:hypothetical protein